MSLCPLSFSAQSVFKKDDSNPVKEYILIKIDVCMYKYINDL